MSPRETAWGAYREITEALRARIAGGEFPEGSALPSEAALCGQYRVARNTVRRALDRLATEGLVKAMPGRGRVVVAAGAAEPVVPQYRAIAAELRELIASGRWGQGEALPSESELARRYGVGRGTVRHALGELEGAGLVEAVHGVGRFVRGR